MRRLIIFRHAKAVPHGSAPDFDRALAPRGVKDATGAMQRPAKMAPRPEPPFHPHSTLLAPTAATPTPAMEDTREYVEETWAELRVHHMTQIAAPADAQVKARSWTPALPLNAAMGIIPFLMVEAVLAPTVRAPVTSKIKQRTMACW